MLLEIINNKANLNNFLLPRRDRIKSPDKAKSITINAITICTGSES